MKKVKLITEMSYDFQIVESESKGMSIVGVFSTADVKNNNKRRYKKELLEREIKKLYEQKVSKKCCFGELSHPSGPDVNLDRVAILIKELEWRGNDVYGKAKVLDTPNGNIAKELIKEASLGISSRGLGTVNSDGFVNEDFNLLTYDLVSEPSNPTSWVNGIYEGKEFEVYSDEPEEEKIIEKEPTIEEAKQYLRKKIWQVIENIEKSS